MRLRLGLVAFCALVAIAVGFWQLSQGRAGLEITPGWVGGIPVTVFRLPAAGRAPAVVIAHGFAGSQQLMQPFAETLARNGMVAVTFDFPGHGRNPAPMLGGLANEAARNQVLQDALAAVIGFTRTVPGGDGRIALLGHSMATDIVVRQAIAQPGISATVAVSLFSPAVTAASPRNLLVIDGALEPEMLIAEGRRVVAQAAGGEVAPRVTYGSFADGTARRLSLSGGVEHIGVLFSAQSLAEARDWLNQAFGLAGDAPVDRRAPWLGVLFAGLVVLAWPLSRLLPVAARPPCGAGLGWRRMALPALAPPVLTPLLLWKLPTSFLPILLGDYLTVHFAVYGALTALAIRIVGKAPAQSKVDRRAIVVGAVAVAAYAILAIGLPLDWYVTSFMPTRERLWLVAAVFCGTLPWFLADEWLTRGPGAARGGGIATRLLFVLSLALAVGLNLPRLFFLIIIIPVILIFLTVYSLFGRWTYARTGHPLPAAIGNAAALAWAIAATFPVVGE